VRRQTGRGLFQSNFLYWTVATVHGAWLRRRRFHQLRNRRSVEDSACLLPGFLLSVHPLDVLAAIRQLFARVDKVSVLALLQKDGVSSIFFRMMVSELVDAGIEPPSPVLPIEPCAFGSGLHVANNRIAFGSSRKKVTLHLSVPLKIDLSVISMVASLAFKHRSSKFVPEVA
jgi:hypothetical protein